MDMKNLYETTDLTYQQIADRTGKSFKQVFSFIKKNYSAAYRRDRKSRTYSNAWKLHHSQNPALQNREPTLQRVADNKGYFMVLKPEWYTGRKASRYVFEHHVVVCEALGLSEIPRGYVVHHCNSDPGDNSFDNLVLLTMSGHMKLHAMLGRATTIPKGSTLKWAEAQGVLWKHDDIV